MDVELVARPGPREVGLDDRIPQRVPIELRIPEEPGVDVEIEDGGRGGGTRAFDDTQEASGRTS